MDNQSKKNLPRGTRVIIKDAYAFYGGIPGTIVQPAGDEFYYVMQPEAIMTQKKCATTNGFYAFEFDLIEPCAGCLAQNIQTEEAWLAHFREAHATEGQRAATP